MTGKWWQAQWRDHREVRDSDEWNRGCAIWDDYHAARRDAEALQAEMPFADVRVVQHVKHWEPIQPLRGGPV